MCGLKTLETYSFIVLEVGNHMKMQQDHILSTGSSREFCLPFSGLVALVFLLDFDTAILNFMHLYVAFPAVCVFVSFLLFL